MAQTMPEGAESTIKAVDSSFAIAEYVKTMTRPCFLIIDKEYVGSISTRKLVVETAKFNVITAYSRAEAIATLKRFPAVNGIVLDAGMADIPASEVCKSLKSVQPEVPIVLVGRPGQPYVAEADHYIESFEPTKVLDLLRRLEPASTAEIREQNAILEAEASEDAAGPR